MNDKSVRESAGRNRTPNHESVSQPADASSSRQYQIADQIRERILSGTYIPGTRLIERTLASELGVSRIPVRDALNILRGEGYVSAFPNRGMVVTTLTNEDVEELFEVREALEVLAVRRATARATPSELLRLAKVLSDSKDAAERRDPRAVGRCNQEFHDLLMASAHNSLLVTMMEPLEGRLHWLLRQNDDPRPLHDEHIALLDAIRSGDPDRAAAQALAHVRTSRRIWLESEARKSETGVS
ncbi:GntR family transcriptional regulator [Paramicrobacterium chengjingii]|uniref:GntR family transcriptional regulator n=2 Tax=Paramicrobacterium chengjingii TaxID=2769067 RepID=A0ABX6YHJ9_9MICO|nr:GntR family transcriptional regulator [Microbacterium chengjingii]QPZ38080.1 GntR family transcriptional regulator [Microbacterium chengjingii]